MTLMKICLAEKRLKRCSNYQLGLVTGEQCRELSYFSAEGSEFYDKNIPLALHYTRSFLRMLDTDRTLNRDDAINEALTVVGALLQDENIDQKTLLSGIELANQLIDVLRATNTFGDAQQLSLAKTSLVTLSETASGNRNVEIFEAQQNLASALLALNYGQYHALVIGNDEYEFLPNLDSAVANAL